MNQYLFVLGRETKLCFAELETVMSVVDPAATIQNLPIGIALVQRAPNEAEGEVGPAGEKTELPLPPTIDVDTGVAVPLRSSDRSAGWWVGRLGGTRLIARVLDSVPQLTAVTFDAVVPADVRELALSSPTVSARERMKLLVQLKKLRPGLRYRPTDDSYLASALSERLIRRDDSLELLLIPNPTPGVGFMVAQVVAVQDTRAWTERDRGLPSVDPVTGMLPPKLARIMVNLAEPARESREHATSVDLSDSPLSSHRSTLLDPFCGSGQIPIEALRLGWTVIASDLDPQSIERTKTNLAWTQERSPDAAKQQWTAFQSDVVELTDHVPAGSVSAIVTEPDLGPPLRSSSAVPTERELDRVTSTIHSAFVTGRALLPPGGRVVIVIPIIAGVRIYDRLDAPATAGYTLEASFTYARPDARVVREIFIFTRKANHGA